MELRWMTEHDTDTVATAGHLFDYPVRPEVTSHFLAQPNHHLAIAYVDGAPAGFISGVEVTHPDKGTEMFLYELGVEEQYRGRGLGRSLTSALANRARARGCYGMWVLTEPDNAGALATYRSAGSPEHSAAVMLTWQLDPTHQTFTDPGT